MLKTERRTIGDLDVTTTQLPAMRSYALLAKLGKIVGPALTQLGNVHAGGLAGLILQNLNAAELPALTCELLASTSVQVDGRVLTLDRPEAIDAAFGGRLPALLSVMKFALEVGYADFFDGGAMSLSALFAEVPAPANASTSRSE